MNRWQMKMGYLALILCGLVVANVFIYREVFAPPVLTVHVLAVTKDTAVVARTPSGATILIDTGPDASILRALGAALPMWQRRIDAIVLTSSSAKAVGGLKAVRSHYRVGTIERSPYGKRLSLDGVFFEVLSTASPTALKISYGSASLLISSSTPAGLYTSDGKIIK